jgi:UDP-N-acetyl-D-mannosaminuronic acid dehydrogenase
MRVGVLGLGRVGLPNALVLAEAGHDVVGIDSDREVVKAVQSGRALFHEPHVEDLLGRLGGRGFRASCDLEAFWDREIILVTIGLDLNGGQVDVRPLYEVVRAAVAACEGRVVIGLRTTVPIGTTRGLYNYLRESSANGGDRIHVAFVPERLVEGRAIEEERRLPKIVGPLTEYARATLHRCFQPLGCRIVDVSTPEAAEAVKLADNAFRCTMFGFANDLAILCEANGVDALEVIEAANVDYPRNRIPVPSCGVSGYCLTKDPRILELSFESISRERGFGSVWHYARMANDYAVARLAREVLKALDGIMSAGGPVGIAVCGLTYKEDTDDLRMSHGIELCRALVRSGHPIEVHVHDPYVSLDARNPYCGLPGDLRGVVSIHESLEAALANSHVAVFTVPHREYAERSIEDIVRTMKNPTVVFDGWNIYRSQMRGRKLAGFRYRGVGYG